MFTFLLAVATLSLTLPFNALASSHGSAQHRRHGEIAEALNNATDVVTNTIHRRGQTYTGARLTFYDAGLGACGKTNTASDFIVALNSGMYGGGYPGPNCFRPISITYKGKTVSATIMDECPGCPSNGGLDLTEGLFKALASLDDGVIYADWHFTDEGGESDPKPTTSKKPEPPTTTWEWKPETTTTPKTTSTTHKEEPKTTTTPKPSTTSSKPETTSTTSTSSKPSIAALTHSSSSKTTSSTPAPAPTPTGPDTLNKLNQAFVGLNELMVAAAQAA
ncbi:RlpA-like double-psi beta-barrel-protein domain-containing protein-containing protein [Daedaleopsis nitida]|nr:RlpA-like double-psi beta-barrel-protein domain-containing protein-containing protein [Daedaleopsis nitida]